MQVAPLEVDTGDGGASCWSADAAARDLEAEAHVGGMCRNRDRKDCQECCLKNDKFA